MPRTRPAALLAVEPPQRRQARHPCPVALAYRAQVVPAYRAQVVVAGLILVVATAFIFNLNY